MNIPNCVPGIQAGELKDLGGLADFRAAYQQQARQSFVPPAGLLAPQQVRQFPNWTASPHAQAAFGYQPYPYQLYPNQGQLPGWQQVSQVPDSLKAALQLPQAQPLASFSSDISQSSREEAQLASFLQAQHTFLQRGTSALSASLTGPSTASYGTSPSRRTANPLSASSPSKPLPPTSSSHHQQPHHAPTSSASYPPDHRHAHPKAPPDHTGPPSRRTHPPAPLAATTSLASHASHSTAAHPLSPLPPPSTTPPPPHLSDDLLMRVVRGDGNAIDTLSHSAATAHPTRPAPSPACASHPGSMWSKPTHTPSANPASSPSPATTKPPTATNPAAPPSTAHHPHPPASQQATAALDARLASLSASPAAVKALLGSTDYYHARRTMLAQQLTFLHQLADLHRIVATQKLLTAELRHPEHSHTAMHQAVSQQKQQLEQLLGRDLHLLRNIPATLRNPWLAQANLDTPPTPAQFRISKDTPQGKSLPRPTPQHPSTRRPPLPTSAPVSAPPPPAWAPSTSSQPLRTTPAPTPTLPLTPAAPTLLPKPTLIRPTPTALQPPPAMHQPVDMHSMWVAKHGAAAASLSAGSKPQPSTSLAPIDLPSQMTGQQLTGLSSDCIASFGLGLSSLSGCTNSLAPSLKETSTQPRTRVRYWWQDEAGTFADVGLPDDLQVASRTRAESSMGFSGFSNKDTGRERNSEAIAPPKKRAKYKEGSQGPSAAPAPEAPPASTAERWPQQQQERQAGAATTPAAAATAAASKEKEKEAGSKPRQKALSGKNAPRSKRGSAGRPGNHSGDSGSSECSAPTQERAQAGAESKPPLASSEPAAAASKEDTVTDNRLDLVGGQSTAHSAANILLSISSSFRPV